MKKAFCAVVFVFACIDVQLCAYDDISEIVKRVAFENERQEHLFERDAIQYSILLHQNTVQQSSVDARAIQELYTDPAARGSYEDTYTVK